MEEIEKYLDTGPWNGKKLREEMKRVGYCVSGSRAVPFTLNTAGWRMPSGEGLQKSDWDFYTDGTIKSLGETIESLESLGVKFQTLLGNFNARIEQSKDELRIGRVDLSILHRHWEELQSDQNDNDYPLVDKLFAQLEKWFLELLPDSDGSGRRQKLITISATSNLLVVVDTLQKYPTANSITGRHPNYTSYGNLGLTVIEGQARGGVPIQVIAKANETVEAVIIQFHSTVVQCWIGGDGAAHLYKELGSQNEFYFWYDNRQSPRKAEKAKWKYESRGFKHIQHPSEDPRAFKLRRLSDDEAMGTPSPREPVQKCVPPLDLEWLEYAGRTALTNPRRLHLSEKQPNKHFWRHVNSYHYSRQISTKVSSALSPLQSNAPNPLLRHRTNLSSDLQQLGLRALVGRDLDYERSPGNVEHTRASPKVIVGPYQEALQEERALPYRKFNARV